MSGHEQARLSRFQVEIAGVFFGLPESVGFLLAGGGALIAQGLIERDTDDLDFFASRTNGDVAAASDALTTAAGQRGWAVEVIRTGAEYRRLRIAGPAIGDEEDEVYVDLAVDTPPTGKPTITIAGPSLPPYELAVRKTLALFGRAEPRDFTDVHSLHELFDRDELLHAAAQGDGGFDVQVFVQMLRSHRRLADEDFPMTAVTVAELRAYFDAWADRLEERRT